MHHQFQPGDVVAFSEDFDRQRPEGTRAKVSKIAFHTIFIEGDTTSWHPSWFTLVSREIDPEARRMVDEYLNAAG